MNRLIVLGARHIHLADTRRVTRRRSDVEVVGVVEDDPRLSARWAARFAAPVLDGTALSTREAEGCLVYGTTSAHRRLTRCAAEAGLPIFVEKPLAADAAEARRVAEQLDGRSQIGFFLRYDEALTELGRRVRAGALGQVHRARARFVHGGWAAGWFDEDYRWMAGPSEGGGGFFDLAGHCLDILEQVIAPIERIEEATLTGAHHGEARLRLKDGVEATVEAGWQGRRMMIEVAVQGREGHAVARDGCLVVDDERVLSGAPPSAERAIDVWLDRLAGRSAPATVPVADAVRNVELLDRIRRRVA